MNYCRKIFTAFTISAIMFCPLYWFLPDTVMAQQDQPVAELTLYFFAKGDSCVQKIEIHEILRDSVSIDFSDLHEITTGAELRLKGYNKEKTYVLRLKKEAEHFNLTFHIQDPPYPISKKGEKEFSVLLLEEQSVSCKGIFEKEIITGKFKGEMIVITGKELVLTPHGLALTEKKRETVEIKEGTFVLMAFKQGNKKPKESAK